MIYCIQTVRGKKKEDLIADGTPGIYKRDYITVQKLNSKHTLFIRFLKNYAYQNCTMVQ